MDSKAKYRRKPLGKMEKCLKREGLLNLGPPRTDETESDRRTVLFF